MTVAYLASVRLNPLRRGAQNLISNRQRVHAAVAGVVPPAPNGRLLWRLEERRNEVELLILSPTRPTLDHIVEQAGWIDNPDGAPRVASLDPLLGQVSRGRQFEFRVALNPVVSTRSVAHPTGGQAKRLESGQAVRVAHRTAAHQLEWFLDRTVGEVPRWGFTVGSDPEDAQVQIVGREQVRFSRGRGAGQVHLNIVTFQGRLEVVDVDVFKQALLNGIGKAKAYGCGLLTLAPPRTVDVVARGRS
ncbi:type I-E CRISPR-associated protein Cas6/Cse3/CasE [Parenemella sanctibonifatiensis]|uniref:type I-E CRISPR-associated protein Cas6/Cse3/CasE n=1 Tax=Parenemella sanctibonifatiensis TaxID=2016505 RepID=UPI0015C65E07|nr:type I-E CRISPR-associated protein Cas6/Cse3/CasE [Parenemella sanctibonifatiensis]